MARTRAKKGAGPAYKPPLRMKRQKKWWKDTDRFTVEYIECAISVPEGAVQSWYYYTKWYLYSRRENTWETASTFEDCEYPILRLFWKSAGNAIPTGHVEPETGPPEGGYEFFESTEAYRRRETRETMIMEDEEEIPIVVSDRNGTKTAASVEKRVESSNETEATVVMDGMTQLAIEGEATPLQTTDQRDLSTPVSDYAGSASSDSSSMYEPEEAPATHQTMPPTSNSNIWENTLPANETVAPLGTVIPNKPKNFLFSKRSRVTHYPALRPRNTPTSLNFTGSDFRTTPLFSLRDKEAMPFKRETGSSRQEQGSSLGSREVRMKYFHEAYTKEVARNRLEQLRQLPPGMELASWETETGVASPQAEDAAADALLDEYLVPEPPTTTLGDFPVQNLDMNISF